MDPWKGKSVESALHDLSEVASALAEKMFPYFEGDISEEESGTWEAKLARYRRVLLHQANAITDVYGPVTESNGMRAGILWDLLVGDLKKFGIVLTQDGTDFTFEGTGATDGQTEDGR